MISSIVGSFCGNVLLHNRHVDYEVPEPYEEELEQELDVYEPEKTHECYLPIKQLPLDHIAPMFVKYVLIAKTCLLCSRKCYVLCRLVITYLVVEVGLDTLLSL